MIVVNIQVPALETVYNFSVEETAAVADLIEELVDMINQKEGIKFSGKRNEMVLCSITDGVQCRSDRSLNDYGICGGAELILV